MNPRTSLEVQIMTFSTLADVRSQIDSIDSELVSLIAQRAECVQAA
ncbi:chorismate mutase, partial [Klebsiella pneumoniae]